MTYLKVGHLYRSVSNAGIFDMFPTKHTNGCWCFHYNGDEKTIMSYGGLFIVLTKEKERYKSPSNRVSVYKVLYEDKIGYIGVPDDKRKQDERVEFLT